MWFPTKKKIKELIGELLFEFLSSKSFSDASKKLEGQSVNKLSLDIRLLRAQMNDNRRLTELVEKLTKKVHKQAYKISQLERECRPLLFAYRNMKSKL